MKNILLLFLSLLIAGCGNKKSTDSPKNAEKAEVSLIKTIAPDVKITKFSISVDAEYLAFLTLDNKLLLYSVKEGRIKENISKDVFSAQFVNDGIYYVRKVFNPLKVNRLNYFKITTSEDANILETRDRIIIVESDGQKVAIESGEKIKVFDGVEEVPLRNFAADFSYNVGNKIFYYNSSLDELKSVEVKGEVVWSDYKSGKLVYYVKRQGLFYSDLKENITRVGEYFYPTLSSDGKYLLAVEESYSNQKLIFSSVNLFGFTGTEWKKIREFSDAMNPVWSFDYKNMLLLNKENKIEIYNIEKQEIHETN